MDALAPTIQLDVLEDSFAPGLGVADVNGSRAPASEIVALELLRCLTSQQIEVGGWARVIQAALRPIDIHRVTNSSIQIVLPDARENYEITRPETITITAPEASLLSGRQVVALPRFVIYPTPGYGFLSNSLVTNNSETDVQGGGMRLTVKLVDDTWSHGVGQRGGGTARSLTNRILRAFFSAQDEPDGWSA